MPASFSFEATCPGRSTRQVDGRPDPHGVPKRVHLRTGVCFVVCFCNHHSSCDLGAGDSPSVDPLLSCFVRSIPGKTPFRLLAPKTRKQGLQPLHPARAILHRITLASPLSGRKVAAHPPVSLFVFC